MVTPANNNYAPPQSAVADIVAADDVKAGRGTRFAAALVDTLLLFVPMGPAYAHAWPTLMQVNAAQRSTFAVWGQIAATGTWFYMGVACFMIVLTINGVLAYRNGQTIGKKWLGIKDVRTDGSRATFARIFWLRNVVSIVISLVPMVGSVYGLVDTLFIFGAAKRCVHDYLADTIVIRA